MVADLRRLVHPRIDVDVLVLGMLLYGIRDEHMVQLLGVHIENVGVALDGLDAHDGVQVTEPRNGDVALEWGDRGELIEVASGDDLSLLVLIEDGLYHVSCQSLQWMLGNHHTLMKFAVSSACVWRSATPPFTGGRASP